MTRNITIDTADRFQITKNRSDKILIDFALDGSDGSIFDFQEWIPKAISYHLDCTPEQYERVKTEALSKDSIRDIAKMCDKYHTPYTIYGDEEINEILGYDTSNEENND